MKGGKKNKMNKLTSILVTLIGIIYTIDMGFELYTVPYGSAIIGIAILVIGVPTLALKSVPL